jgi:hypothetical protein
MGSPLTAARNEVVLMAPTKLRVGVGLEKHRIKTD